MLSLGYVLLAAITLPMGFMNLDENMAFQAISGAILALVLGQFAWSFAFDFTLHPTQVPSLFGVDLVMATGIILFCFTFVDTIPSW